jgi:hypothetical protein
MRKVRKEIRGWKVGDLSALCYTGSMKMEFTGKIWYWRGPAPYYFITVPEEESLDIKAISGFVTYGWGVIPVWVRIGETEWTTSLFPKDGRYLVPVKDSVRKAEQLELDDEVTIELEVRKLLG